MGVGDLSVAAADATVRSDLAEGEWWQQVGYDRVLTGIGVAGSAAAADTILSLSVDTNKVGDFRNVATGQVLQNQHMRPLSGNYVPAGTRLHIFVEDAPATNPINVVLTWNP